MSKMFSFRLRDNARRRLVALSSSLGLSRSDLLHQLIFACSNACSPEGFSVDAFASLVRRFEEIHGNKSA